MANAVSPLAVPLPELPPLAGVRLSATAAGIRYQGRTDVVMMEVAPNSTVAGVFTSNKCPGAPVDWCRASLKGGKARMVVVNAGNANVFTGKAGRDACAATAAAAAKLAGCPAKQVFVASTGVIGEVLPHEKLIAVLPALQEALAEDGWEAAARGHHDDRHVPQGVDPDGADRRRDGADHRDRQGQRHDRAGYGDDAVLRVHRCEDSGGCAADDAEEGRGWQLQLHDGRFGYFDLGYGAADRHRSGEASADSLGRRQRGAQPHAGGFRPGVERACCWIWRCR